MFTILALLYLYEYGQ